MERQVQYRRMQRMRIRCKNDGIAYAARMLGFSPAAAEADREKLFDSARSIFSAIENGEVVECDIQTRTYCAMAASTAAIYEQAENDFELEMIAMIKTLPARIISFVEGIKGFALPGLAHMLGETGDLSNYANPAKVWKRLGLAPYNGRAGSEWKKKGGLTAEEWVGLGYVAQRRSVMHVIADPLLKTNFDGKKPDRIPLTYRAKYDARKAHTEANRPDWTKAHRHMDAMRIMVKELVKDLWVEWNRK